MCRWKRCLLLAVVMCGALMVANYDNTAEAQWGYRVGVYYPSYYYPAYYPSYSTFYSSYYTPAYYPAYYPSYGVRYGAWYPRCW